MKLLKLLIYTARWLKGGLMEWVPDYQPNVFKNEVPVFLDEMTDLFKKYKVYVFGYGSLLYPSGWAGRWMMKRPMANKLIECHAHGVERGPWGLYNSANYYGIIPKENSVVNGVVTRIWDLKDWTNLMATEMIAGLYRRANYRVVDITDNIIDWPKKPKSARIHCVMNRPKNRELVSKSIPAYQYYDRVWDGVKKYRSPEFAEEFLKLGGFKSTFEALAFIVNKRKGEENVISQKVLFKSHKRPQ
jgi:hypothetical protein